MLKFFVSSIATLSLLAGTAFGFTLKPPEVTAAKQITESKGDGLVLSDKNTVVFRGEVNTKSVSAAITALQKIKEPTVFLYLSSPGGSIIDGLQLIDAMHGLNKRITCVTDFSASMAFVIFQACHDRLVLNSSVLMQHVPSAGTAGNLPNMVSFVNLLKTLNEDTDAGQADRMGMSLADFRKLVRDDYWTFGSNAVKQKAADRVTSIQCSDSLTEKEVLQTFSIFGFTVNVKWSGCPLITAPLAVEVNNNGRLSYNDNTLSKVQQFVDNQTNFRENFLNREVYRNRFKTWNPNAESEAE